MLLRAKRCRFYIHSGDPTGVARTGYSIRTKQHLHRDLTGIHVLMAEDNDLNAELATIILEDAGMTVTRASDGKKLWICLKIIHEAHTILF